MKKDFEFLPHTADLKIRAYGNTLEELFCHALIGMFQAIGPKSASCKCEKDRVICESLPISRQSQSQAPMYQHFSLISYPKHYIYQMHIMKHISLVKSTHSMIKPLLLRFMALKLRVLILSKLKRLLIMNWLSNRLMAGGMQISCSIFKECYGTKSD